MKSPMTLEGEIAALEREVNGFKTKQQFYEGQFETSWASFDSPAILTNKTFTSIDGFLTCYAPEQNMIVEPYLEVRLTSDDSLLQSNKAQYLVHQLTTNAGGTVSASIEFNVNVFNVPIGTSVYMRVYYTYSGNVTITRVWSIRP
jgi:hypothetical protein